MPVQLARAEAKAGRLWQAGGETRADALRAMRAVVAGTHVEPELGQVARRHLLEGAAWEILFWRRWPRRRALADSSRERLRAACSQGRGVVLSACHYGPQFMTVTMLVAHGVEPCIVSNEWFFAQPTPDAWGRRLAHWRREVPDLPRLRARGSYGALHDILVGGRPVLLYFDLPGRNETDFLGKTVSLVDGSARLAVEADALVLPMRTRREGAQARLDVEEALDPRHFAGPDELHQQLARMHERLILDEPAAMHDPADYGWGDGAGPLRWAGAPARRVAPAG